MGKIGDLCESDLRFKWKIKDFLQLSHKVNIRFESAELLFSGIYWEIWIFTNARTSDSSEGWVSLYLQRKSAGLPVTLTFSLGLETREKNPCFNGTATYVFEKQNTAYGFSKVIRRSEIIKRKSQLLPSGVLTVIGSIKHFERSNTVENGYYKVMEENVHVDAFAQTDEETGVWKLQQHFREILENGSISDVVLKVDDQEFKSHRCVLAARSPVFLAMMSHELKEKNSGIVDIPDVDPSAFSDFLNYLYTGSEQNVTSQNVVKLYIAADKYQVEELRKVCIDYMLKNIAVDNFCDFLTLALKYVEKDLTDACSKFFIENSLAIVLTSKWQAFLNENTTAGNELFVKAFQHKK